MSGFNTIKKSRKRSHEIEEKLNVLNRELEKTKDIQEQPTMHTGDMYTPVVTTPPTEFQGPLDVPNTSGVGEEGFTQSSAGSGEEGHAPTYSSLSDLKNSSVNRPIFQSPNDIEGAEASYGVVSYNLSGAGTNYGIIVDGNIVEGILSGFIAGGTRPASYYVDIYEAYLATNAASPGYYTDEQIAEKRIHAARATSIESIRNSAAEKGLEFNIPWQGYRPPNMFADSTPYGTSYVHPTRGTLILAGFNLLGMAEKYHIAGDRGGTTPGDSKGTGDPDQYPPIPWFERLGREAFERLKEFAEAVGDFAMKEPYDIVDDIKDAYGYRAEIAISALNDEEFVRTNEEVTDREKEDLKNDLDVDNIPINKKQTGYSDERFYENENGGIVKKKKNPLDDIDIDEPNWQEKITPEVRKKYEEWKKENEEHPDNTDFVSKVQNQSNKEKVTTADVGGLAGRGKAHHEFVDPSGNNEDAYYYYKDYAYAASDSKDPAEFPNPIDAAAAAVVGAAAGGSRVRPQTKIKDKYGEEITGMSVVEVKIPYSEWTQEMKDSFNKRKSGNKNESLYLRVRKNLKENTYMALLDRTYKPSERDYVKYAVDTPDGRKQFDKDIKMVHKFIKKNPDKYEYVLKRYPKDDPRLSMLNYKMDRMTEASDKYLETQFPTNQDLFTKVKERTKKNMNLTDPKNFKPVKDPIKYVDVKKTKKLKETVTRHFNKPVKSKSMFGLNMGKVRKKNQKMVEKREQENRIKEKERAYIQEKMSRQKSNWKDDLTDL